MCVARESERERERDRDSVCRASLPEIVPESFARR